MLKGALDNDSIQAWMSNRAITAASKKETLMAALGLKLKVHHQTSSAADAAEDDAVFDTFYKERPRETAEGKGRLALRDGKPGYLDDIPLVMRYIEEVLALYRARPEVSAFSDWWKRIVAPAKDDWDNIVQRVIVQRAADPL